ncbi:hypothetical protein ACFWWS_35605 [Streptomyces sp. NPDC059083]|uniref:hypothetical protein n=1 Tax=Streptomyces sp. NPDC059083 TaxID=3346721 RepID=UPI0036854051
MELSYSDRRLARERLDRHLLESARELATDWDRITSVDLSASASRDVRAANTRALSGLPTDATALEIATALQLLIALRHDVDLLEDGLIKAALDRGMSWEQLGAAYGKTTRQAMHQHAKRLDTRIREDTKDDVYSLPLMAADDPA